MAAPDEIKLNFPFVLHTIEVEAPHSFRSFTEIAHPLKSQMILYFKSAAGDKLEIKLWEGLQEDWDGIELAEYELILKRKKYD